MSAYCVLDLLSITCLVYCVAKTSSLELFQGQRDQSVTFGFREGHSTLDIRTSGVEEDLESHRREIFVRRPTSRTSNPESDDVAETPPSGPFGHKDFRMIDASTCDLRDPTDRNRKDSITSIVSGIIMNEQYSRQMALQQQQVNPFDS